MNKIILFFILVLCIGCQKKVCVVEPVVEPSVSATENISTSEAAQPAVSTKENASIPESPEPAVTIPGISSGETALPYRCRRY
ncbi:MAG: hypothetical protein JW863_05715 [Chitinispirillaceae bacterium]|nr:hypothetical protein [Chitinispirillaceae bacterium]